MLRLPSLNLARGQRKHQAAACLLEPLDAMSGEFTPPLFIEPLFVVPAFMRLLAPVERAVF